MKRGNARGAKGPCCTQFLRQHVRQRWNDKTTYESAGSETKDIRQGEGGTVLALTVRQDYGWKRWSRWWLVATAESNSGTIGLITLDEKCAGARSAGNPHAACEVAGIGNGITDVPTRAQRGKPRTQTRGVLRITAPILDPTNLRVVVEHPHGINWYRIRRTESRDICYA
jgi:hypothetical protein